MQAFPEEHVEKKILNIINLDEPIDVDAIKGDVDQKLKKLDDMERKFNQQLDNVKKSQPESKPKI